MWKRGVFWVSLKGPSILEQDHKNRWGDSKTEEKGRRPISLFLESIRRAKENICSIRAACYKSFEG